MVVLWAISRVFRLLETVSVRRLFQKGLRLLNHRDLTLTVARWRGLLFGLSLQRKLILLVAPFQALT